MERGFEDGKKMSVFFSTWKEGRVEGIVLPKQSHGDIILNVVYSDDSVYACDALITQNPEVALGVRTADCAPVCFADGQLVGIAHVGWRGLCLGLIEKMLREFDLEKVEIFVGPRLDVFEIQKDACYEAILQKFGDKFFTYEDDKIIFHFKDAIASLLPPSTIFDPRNTGEDATLPSHRRNKTSERLITVVQWAHR